MYIKQNFQDGQVLTAAMLDHMEEGMEALDTQMGDVAAALDEILAMQEDLLGGSL